MNFSFNYFGLLILLFSVGFSTCVDPNDILSYDPEEFDVNDLLNDPMVIDALQSSESDHEEGPSSHEPLKNEFAPALELELQPPTLRKLVCLGKTYKGNKRIPECFDRLEPANVNPNNLTLGELEMKFQKQKYRHPWRELKQYPVGEYTNYWTHVCDYFWEKKDPEDPRYRACYVKPLVFFEQTYATVNYRHIQAPSTVVEVLYCSCYYYVKARFKRVGPPVLLAVYKYGDNEYFILTRIGKNTRNTFEVSKFWTDVVLPVPFK